MPKTYEDETYKHWNNNTSNDKGQKSEEVRQMNIKNKKTGDHTFHNVSSGKEGVALGDFRPSRSK